MVQAMDFIQIISLGLIQGITEFLPVSSSGHLLLVSIILGWEDQGLFMDIVAHGGSLLAVMVYFRKEIRAMLQAITAPSDAHKQKDLRLMTSIIIATVPIVIAGVVLADRIEIYLRNQQVIAASTILFALVLLYADRVSKGQRNEYQLSYFSVILIGCAQIFALIPGASRSGVTMTAALLLGCDKVAAARFSFLLSIPTILAAIVYKTMQVSFADIAVDWMAIAGVFLISAIVAYLCIKVFVKLVDSIGMLPFVIYRIILGLLIFLLV